MSFTGRNDGALPVSVDNTLRFDIPYGTFNACSHEIECALRHGLITIDKVHKVYLAQESTSFAEFVNDFYAEKVAAKLAGDELTEMFSKFMLNSCYGKFGQSPDNFMDWFINHDFGNDVILEANGYTKKVEYEEFELWARPALINKSAYYNVAIAASITSAARSILLDGLQKADRPIYCDTDSIFCRGFTGEISDTTLGAFKLEKTAPMAAIAGKKLYTLYSPETLAKPKTVWNSEFKEHDPNPDRKPLKLSSKGGTLTMDDIIELCRGGEVLYENDAPTFSTQRETRFIKRRFRMTGVDEPEIEL